MPTYNYDCKKCEISWEDVVPYDQRDHQACPQCGTLDIYRHFPAPMVLKASYPDGTKRFSEMKEISKLQVERARTLNKGENRKAIESEIRKLGGKVE